MINQEIARILYNMAIYLEMNDEMIFKIRAYEKAAQLIESMSEDLEEIYKKDGRKGLEEIEGIGKGLSEKIEEYIKTGKIKTYEEIKKKVPIDVEKLTSIEGLGAKRIKILYKKLKIKSIDDLEKAAKEGKISKLEGFGEKSEQNILKGIEFQKSYSGRFTIINAMPLIREIEKRLGSLSYVEKCVVAGSTRRRKETIGDADILIVSDDSKKVMDYFTTMPEIFSVSGKGETKSTVKLKIGLQVDVRVVPRKSFGAALNYFTGNKDHNIALRKIAISLGLKLNEYGVFKGAKQVAGKTEEEVYKVLGLNYIEPELRENTGEIEASKQNKLPKVISYQDLKGDCQTQTNWTDGSDTIKEMALAAKSFGLEYIAITDHTKSLSFVNGLNENRLEKQRKEIDKINKEVDIKILQGAEVNILKDGSLDINNDALKKLDFVGVSVHSLFNLPKEDQTKRIVKAMNNTNVDVLFHPTGRIVQKREPYQLDMDVIIDTAKETGTILEINSSERLDLKDEYIKKCIKKGVKLIINSDAHSKNQFSLLEFGIAQARRGWAEKKDVVNTRKLDEFLKFLK